MSLDLRGCADIESAKRVHRAGGRAALFRWKPNKFRHSCSTIQYYRKETTYIKRRVIPVTFSRRQYSIDDLSVCQNRCMLTSRSSHRWQPISWERTMPKYEHKYSSDDYISTPRLRTMDSGEKKSSPESSSQLGRVGGGGAVDVFRLLLMVCYSILSRPTGCANDVESCGPRVSGRETKLGFGTR
jgi:hypothetical protein